MRRWLWLVLALVSTVASAGRLTTFAWTPGADWPPGTTVELCGNGGICLSGITSTQATLDLPVQPGEVIEGLARAVAPAGYQCGDPPAPCPYSDWATVAQTWPLPGIGLWAKYQQDIKMAANIVTTGKKTQTNSTSVALSSFTINSGTNLALFAIWCGNYNTTPTATWNPGSSTPMTGIVVDTQSSYGACAAFVLVNPTTGTGTVTISGLNSDEDSVLYVFVAENVNQSTPTADSGGDTAGTGTSKTLTIANMTANDLAAAAISIDSESSTITITTGNNIGTDSTDYTGAGTYTDAGAAYNTGTGNVDIVFGKNAVNGGALKFRIVGTAASTPTALPRRALDGPIYGSLRGSVR